MNAQVEGADFDGSDKPIELTPEQQAEINKAVDDAFAQFESAFARFFVDEEFHVKPVTVPCLPSN